jgi:hypothetical protein
MNIYIYSRDKGVNIMNLTILEKTPFVVLIILENLLIISCAGLNDWNYKLPNGYEIWRSSANNIKIGLASSNSTILSLYNYSDINHEQRKLIGIPPKVLEFCYNSRYVLAKTVLLTDMVSVPAIWSEDDVFYYILDTENRELLGPFSDKSDFLDAILSLSLEEELSDWYSTRAVKLISTGFAGFGQPIAVFNEDSIVPGPFGETRKQDE